MALITFDPDLTEDVEFVKSIIAPVTVAPGEPVIAQTAAPAPAQTVDPQAGVPLDANGTPWIAEVHAGNKAQTKAGTWKKKRGVTDEVLTAAEAEARAKLAATPPAPAPETLPPAVAPNAMPAPVVSIQEVTAKWNECVQAGLIDAANGMAIYQQLGLDASQIATSETMRKTLHDYLIGLLNPAPVTNGAMPGGLPGVPGM